MGAMKAYEEHEDDNPLSDGDIENEGPEITIDDTDTNSNLRPIRFGS